jgi:gluconolactonase
VMILAQDGRLLGVIEVDRQVSNCTVGEDGRTLFLTADDTVARIRLRASGTA